MQAFTFEHGSLPGSLELAYIGDTVYDLYVRSALLRKGLRVRDMHKRAVKTVCAHAQAQAFRKIEPNLTETEHDVARRARNAHQSPPKNADPAEYHLATALEALTGYLFVTGQHERMDALLTQALTEEEA